MDKLIKDRSSTIAALIFGTGSGWGFASILTAPELSRWMITIAFAVSLLLSLIISLSLTGTMPVEGRKKMRRNGAFLLIGFLAFVALFFVLYSKYTVTIPWATPTGDVHDTVIIKGLGYTPMAKSYRDSLQRKDQYGKYPSDETLLEDATYEIRKVWSDGSRINAKLMLLFVYTAMIALVVAGVTLIAEAIVHSRGGPAE